MGDMFDSFGLMFVYYLNKNRHENESKEEIENKQYATFLDYLKSLFA